MIKRRYLLSFLYYYYYLIALSFILMNNYSCISYSTDVGNDDVAFAHVVSGHILHVV